MHVLEHQRIPPAELARPATPGSHHHRHHWWRWAVGSALLLAGVGAGAMWLMTSRAIPVTMRQAVSRFGGSSAGTANNSRPMPGVYRYTGTGVDKLTLPPMTQAEGPTMPGTVTLGRANCRTFRIDYSTHHWQTWDYCRHNGSLWTTGGRLWQLWSIGPINISDLTSISCSAGTVALPVDAVPKQRSTSRCTATSSAVKGQMVSTGPYELLGDVILSIGGRRIRAEHFLQLRTDSGSQQGMERSEIWVDEGNGLPLRVQQNIKVTTPSPFGPTAYTQVGTFTITSLIPLR